MPLNSLFFPRNSGWIFPPSTFWTFNKSEASTRPSPGGLISTNHLSICHSFIAAYIYVLDTPPSRQLMRKFMDVNFKAAELSCASNYTDLWNWSSKIIFFLQNLCWSYMNLGYWIQKWCQFCMLSFGDTVWLYQWMVEAFVKKPLYWTTKCVMACVILWCPGQETSRTKILVLPHDQSCLLISPLVIHSLHWSPQRWDQQQGQRRIGIRPKWK